MKVLAVVLVALVAVAAAAPQMEKRMFLPSLSSLKAELLSLLSSGASESLCEAECKNIAELLSFLCPEACTLVLKELRELVPSESP